MITGLQHNMLLTNFTEIDQEWSCVLCERNVICARKGIGALMTN